MNTKFLAVLLLIMSYWSPIASAKFQSVAAFGANPGQLTGSVLAASSTQRPLVVLLHGCGQSGESLAKQSGFLKAATAKNFSLLVPQQVKSNNMQLCFNWFSEVDQQGQAGELQSIVNMITTTQAETQASSVFIAGLSAGGAMVSNLLTFHPELVTAGAVISGIGYPCANTLIKAISCMKNGPAEPAAQFAKALQPILKGKTRPKLSLFVGAQDKIVAPQNSHHLAKTWSLLQQQNHFETTALAEDVTKTVWGGDHQSADIELYEFKSLGHGWSVNPKQAYGGEVAPYLLEHTKSTTHIILSSWDLL